MKFTVHIALLVIHFLLNAQAVAQQTNNQVIKPNHENKMQQILIDRITVPVNAKDEFTKVMTYNRNFIKGLPGFVKDEVYEQTDDLGNFHFITIAVWQSTDDLKKAKEKVEAEYKRISFDPRAFCQKLNIKMERDIYHSFTNATSAPAN